MRLPKRVSLTNSMKQQWCRANWFKVAFLAICIASAVAAFHRQRVNINHALTLECRKLGEQIERQVNPPEKSQGILFSRSSLNPEFYFNPKLKRCFYYGGYQTSSGTIYEVIFDAYTNQEMFHILRTDESSPEVGVAFDTNKSKLFDERERHAWKHKITK